MNKWISKETNHDRIHTCFLMCYSSTQVHRPWPRVEDGKADCNPPPCPSSAAGAESHPGWPPSESQEVGLHPIHLTSECWDQMITYKERKERKKVKSLSCVWLFATPWTVAYQVPPSMGFSRQEYWSGFPSPSPGTLLNPGIEPRPSAL